MSDELNNYCIEDGDAEDRRTVVRRMFMYSSHAIRVAGLVQNVFVNHGVFNEALEAFDRAFQLGREFAGAYGVTLVGPTGVGKTAVVRYFRSALPPSSLFRRGFGALAIRMPETPAIGHVISTLLRQLEHPFSQVTGRTIGIKRGVLLQALRDTGVRLVFVDEAHNLRTQARFRSRSLDGSAVTDLLKEMMDEVPLAVCLCGGEDLLALTEIDAHLAGRVAARMRMSNFANNGQWKGFVRAFCKQCKAIDLHVLQDKPVADRLFAACKGNPREFKRLITEGVLIAADANRPALTEEHLLLGFSRVYGTHPTGGNPYAS